jgi:hypothetical protein
LKDKVGWRAVVEYIQALDEPLRSDAFVEEQRLLAVAKTGDVTTAIGALKQLIETQGKSAERCGLLGGRYKQLWREHSKAGDEPMAKRCLSRAIEAYEDGMRSDLNNYYPSSNLPPLLHARGRSSDLTRARHLSAMVVEQVQRSLELTDSDEWARPTLLGAAFYSGDVEKAEELADLVENEGAAKWKLDTTLEDLRGIARLAREADVVAQLEAVVERLARSCESANETGQ